MAWAIRTLTGILAGAALLAAMQRMGWVQLHSVALFLSELIDTRILGAVLAPFRWIETAWFQIAGTERDAMTLVWALLIAPTLRLVDVVAGPEPDRPPVRMPFPARLLLAVIGALFLAFALGLFCYLVPAPLAIIVLFGGLAVIAARNIRNSIVILYGAPREGTAPEFIAAGRQRVLLLWTAYAEAGLGAVALALLGWLLA